MKVLVLSNYTPSLVWFRKDLLQEMIKRGHEVHVSAPEPDEEGWLKAMGITFHPISMHRTGVNPFSDLKLLRDYEKLIRQIKPDLLFCYTIKPNIYGAWAGKRAGARRICIMIAGLGNAFKPATSLKSKAVRAIISRMYRSAAQKSDRVIFQNPDDLNELVDMGIVKREKTALVNGSGVNMEQFQPTPLPDNPAFLMVARLLPEKGVMEYLQAARMVKEKRPDVRFMLVGPYDDRRNAIREEDIQPYVQDGVIAFFGEQKDVRPFLSQSSVFVLPSCYREGTPKTLLEAMACGRAIITTDTPGCREAIRHQQNGLMIPPKDADALAEAMLWMADHPKEVESMGQNGLAYCREKYEVSKVNESMLTIMGL